MAYTPKTWRDYPSTETMVMASDLNRIEKGIDDAHKDLEKKIDTPETTGTADQVLTLGADGKPVWSDPSAEITVDDALSDTSENPVQNKVIKAEIDKKANTDDVPAEVTEQTITNWGFTKNTGTYSKPDDGIPKTDLASAVQTSLSMADKIVYGYDDGRIYAVGELVFYNNWIYQCIESCMGVLPTNTTYWKGYANIAAVISELNSNMKWKKLGEVTGTTELSIPTNATELHVKIVPFSTYPDWFLTFNILMEEVNSTNCITGSSVFKGQTNDFVSAYVSIKNNKIKVVQTRFDSTTDRTSTAKMEVWYK